MTVRLLAQEYYSAFGVGCPDQIFTGGNQYLDIRTYIIVVVMSFLFTRMMVRTSTVMSVVCGEQDGLAGWLMFSCDHTGTAICALATFDRFF